MVQSDAGGIQHLSPAGIMRGGEWEILSCVDVAHVRQLCLTCWIEQLLYATNYDVENCLES